MNPGITEEVGTTTRSFMEIMKRQPLSLALVVMNFVLVAYVFYSGSVIIEQRVKTTTMIVEWQKETDKLLQTCVDTATLQKMFDAFVELSKQGRPMPQREKPISLDDIMQRIHGEEKP